MWAERTARKAPGAGPGVGDGAGSARWGWDRGWGWDGCRGEGVELEQARAWIAQNEDLHKKTNAASEAHIPCSSFFGPGGAEKGLVMQRDGWTIEAFELERCCSE